MKSPNFAQGPSTLPQLLQWHATQHPAQTALREKKHGIWQPVSWGQYYERARLVAVGLSSLGLIRGDRIIIASENIPEWVYCDLGAQMIGVEVVGIYPTNPWPELQYIARHCGAKVAICGDQEQTDKVLDAQREGQGLPALEHIFCVDMKGLRTYEPGSPASFQSLMDTAQSALQRDQREAITLDQKISDLTPDQTAVIVYTSGTTGPPKGACLSHSNFIYSAKGFAELTGMNGSRYEAVSYLPLCHAAERGFGMTLHLVIGGTMNFAESIDTVAENVREIAPTYFLGVPRIWEKLQQGFTVRIQDARWWKRKIFEWGMQQGRRLSDAQGRNEGRRTPLQKLERAFLHALLFRSMQMHMGLDRSFVRLCAGAAVSPETLRFFDVIGIPVSQGYGLTESSGLAFVQAPGSNWAVGGCGRALPETSWKLGKDGELFLKSPGIFKGYLHDKMASEQTISTDGWLATGDIVQANDAGDISVVDRKKAIIITSGGKNVAPSELENALRDSLYIQEAIVVGEGKPFIGALIQIDLENVGRWASERKIPYTTFRSLAVLPEVRTLIQQVVNEINAKFSRAESIRRFVLLEKELDHDDGELTATQKVRRAAINQKFGREMNYIYGGES